MTVTGEKIQLELGTEAEKRLQAAHGPVVARFQVTELPEGDAPESIRAAWLTDNLALPVRSKSLDQDTLIPGFPYYATRYAYETIGDYDTPAAVTGLEAIIALRNAEKHDAAEYWKRYFGQNGLLVFHRSEGILTPIQAINEIAEL